MRTDEQTITTNVWIDYYVTVDISPSICIVSTREKENRDNGSDNMLHIRM